jgi:SET domain-containing protein
VLCSVIEKDQVIMEFFFEKYQRATSKITPAEQEYSYNFKGLDPKGRAGMVGIPNFRGNEGIGCGSVQFANHACSGFSNCGLFEDAGRVYLKAIKRIAEGEEMTITYEHAPEPPASCWCCGCTAERTAMKRQRKM